jgi:hypothetical protein
MDQHKNPKNNDPHRNKDRDKDLYLNAIYRDIPTGKDNCIKIASNKDSKCKDNPDKYDYKSLQIILYKDLGIELPVEQVRMIGDGLIDLYQALYFEDL